MAEGCSTIDDIEDFALASQHMAATACRAALAQTRGILGAPASAAGLSEITRLIGMTHRIATCLDIGAQALADDDPDSALLEHARAVMLMNALPLIVARHGQAAPVPLASAADQKSGSTG